MTRRLLFSYLSLTVVVLAMLEVPLGFVNGRNERANLTAKVERDAVAVASLAEGTLEHEPGASNVPALKRLGRRYAADTGGRVLITDRQGVAIVDSTSPRASQRSFANRPEFRAALAGDVATGVRHSQTLGYSFLYVAVPVASGGTVLGAVRITYPTSRLDERVRRYWLALAGIAAIALGVATLVGLRFARWIRHPLEGIEAAAARAGAGDLSARAAVPDAPAELRALALEFNDMVARVDGLVASQGEFVADASHELRTPLTALRLRLENLERHISQDGRNGLHAATAEVERLSKLVDGLLALARTDAVTSHAETVDLAALTAARIDVWQPALERGVHLELETDDVALTRAGSDRLTQVLDNLIGNALHAAPDGSTVTISVHASGTHTELIVRDEGPGMTADEKARAFDRFWRARTSTSGSGLGLAITRRLLDLDGGTIELRDAPGTGLEAVVRLPGG